MKAFAKSEEETISLKPGVLNKNDAPCMGSQLALSLRDGYVVGHVYGCKYIIYRVSWIQRLESRYLSQKYVLINRVFSNRNDFDFFP